MNDDELHRHIDSQMNQRVSDIELHRSPNSFRLKLAENEYQYFEFDEDMVKIDFNSNYYELLESLLKNYKDNLIKLANSYQEKNRDFATFLYDLIVLVYFVNKLPDEFQRLLEKDELQSEGDLMHNRILAQTAHTLNNNHIVKLNKKFKKRSSPDLTVNDFTVDIKTIVGRYNWTTEDVSKLVKTIDQKFEDAMNQTNDGIVFMSFWSKNMNNLFRDYFFGQHNTVPFPLENNSCYFILDGLESLQDFYTSKHVFDLRNNLPTCDFIANHTPITYPSPYSLFQIGRKGFPISKSGPPNNFETSFSFG